MIFHYYYHSIEQCPQITIFSLEGQIQCVDKIKNSTYFLSQIIQETYMASGSIPTGVVSALICLCLTLVTIVTSSRAVTHVAIDLVLMVSD